MSCIFTCVCLVLHAGTGFYAAKLWYEEGGSSVCLLNPNDVNRLPTAAEAPSQRKPPLPQSAFSRPPNRQRDHYFTSFKPHHMPPCVEGERLLVDQTPPIQRPLPYVPVNAGMQFIGAPSAPFVLVPVSYPPAYTPLNISSPNWLLCGTPSPAVSVSNQPTWFERPKFQGSCRSIAQKKVLGSAAARRSARQRRTNHAAQSRPQSSHLTDCTLFPTSFSLVDLKTFGSGWFLPLSKHPSCF